MRSVILCVSLFYCIVHLIHIQAQSIGTPFIQNYTAQDYKLHPKNFAAIQDDRGIMYFGNAYGIMEFDGSDWKQLPLPDGKSAISLAKADNGQIVIGSVSEAGVLSANEIGELQYKSLMSMVPDSVRDFGEVWQTVCAGDDKVFMSHKQLTLISSSDTKVIKPSKVDHVFEFIAEVKGQLYVQESAKGLHVLISDQLKLIPSGELFRNESIYGVLPYQEHVLIVSSRGLDVASGYSIRPVKCELGELIRDQLTSTRAVLIDENTCALGTAKSGMVFFDLSGEIKYVVDKRRGLVSNNVTDMYVDKGQNIWAITNRGLSYVQSGSPFTTINEIDGLEGMGYAAQLFEGGLYLGTSQGLFVRDWKDQRFNDNTKFQPIENAQEQVWFLDVIDDVLLCGDNRGLYEIDEGVARKISNHPYSGGWTARKINDNHFVLGTYEGLELYERKEGRWHYKLKIKGFNESSRFIEVDNELNVWVCHGNKGLYKVQLTSSLDSAKTVDNVSVNQGFANNFINHVSKIGGELVFVSYKKIFRYDAKAKKLVEYQELDDVFENHETLAKIVELSNGKIWSVNGQHIELFQRANKGKYNLISLGLEKLQGHLIGDYELLSTYNGGDYFIGVQDGFIHVDGSKPFITPTIDTHIRKVELINSDSILFEGACFDVDATITRSFLSGPTEKFSVELPFSQNAIRLTYSSNFYEDHSKNLYSYSFSEFPQNGQNKWSMWTESNLKEFTYLPEGEYKFLVRSKNVYGRISSNDSFFFRVLPPWYRTTIAYVVYGIAVVLVVFLFWRILRWRLRLQRLKLEKQKQGELIILQNEKLEADLKFKNAELANLASNLIQKREFLSQLKEELSGVKDGVVKPASDDALSKVIKSVEKDIKFDGSWDHFQMSFDGVYHNFLFGLREQFAFLKPTDLMLCAYIRMQKSNKEIADMLNLSEDSVKKRRVRLKNKLEIQKELKLSEFLIGR